MENRLGADPRSRVLVTGGSGFIGRRLVAALLGFTGIAGGAFAIAKVFALIFGVLFLLFLVLGLSAANRITT